MVLQSNNGIVCKIKKFVVIPRPFQDFRDWFLTEEDKIKNVHHVNTRFYLGPYFIFSESIPINWMQVKFEVEIKTNFIDTTDTIRFCILEMNIFRSITFTPLYLKPDNTYTLNYTLDTE